MIQPTIGRMVHYLTSVGTTLPAVVTKAHDERLVDLVVFGLDDVASEKVSSVRLVQPGDADAPALPYCEWMPFQVKKNYGSESGEKAAGSQLI